MYLYNNTAYVEYMHNYSIYIIKRLNADEGEWSKKYRKQCILERYLGQYTLH
jgi:hypothetical protein